MRSLICPVLLAVVLGCDARQSSVVDPTGGQPPSSGAPGLIPSTVPFTVARFGGIQGYISGSSDLQEPERLVIRTNEEWTVVFTDEHIVREC